MQPKLFNLPLQIQVKFNNRNMFIYWGTVDSSTQGTLGCCPSFRNCYANLLYPYPTMLHSTRIDRIQLYSNYISIIDICSELNWKVVTSTPPPCPCQSIIKIQNSDVPKIYTFIRARERERESPVALVYLVPAERTNCFGDLMNA